MDLSTLIRKNILNLKPYSCARDEFKGEASIFIDANESPFDTSINRYPDPLQKELKEVIAKIKNIPSENIFLGNGSDEPIDLAYRVFCEPGIDNVTAIDPTYGMYKVCADINNIEYRNVTLSNEYHLRSEKILEKVDNNTKIIWICSPNNPTGNLLDENEITKILNSFNGIVIIDEAYIDFAQQDSWITKLPNFKNLIVLQTLSKAWGCAAIRLGMAFASNEIINVLNKVKYPYNINILTQQQALIQLSKIEKTKENISYILQQREILSNELKHISIVEKVYKSDSNFLLVKVKNANATYNYLAQNGIIVRNRNNITLCDNCLRITIGLAHENEKLIASLKTFAANC
ncbi:MAG: histidinol-phosphate transaminase [Paludibacteraceae bacterium]|nr:histidinol-phosphate transaminase [Paludibacteraceae bacterium]